LRDRSRRSTWSQTCARSASRSCGVDAHRLEVSVTEPDVRVRPVGVLVEVEERPGPELEVRGVPADLYQAVDRTQGSDQILVAYPGAVIRFPQLSRRQRSARLPTADPTRRHGRRSSVAAPAMSSRFASELGPPDRHP
jgi:hypothetical protein